MGSDQNFSNFAGTSSVDHLRANLMAATLQLPPEMVDRLGKIVTENRQLEK